MAWCVVRVGVGSVAAVYRPVIVLVSSSSATVAALGIRDQVMVESTTPICIAFIPRAATSPSVPLPCRGVCAVVVIVAGHRAVGVPSIRVGALIVEACGAVSTEASPDSAEPSICSVLRPDSQHIKHL